MSASIDVCRDGLGQFLRRELTEWDGLPDGCAEQDVARWLPLVPGEGIARLGSQMVEYRFRVLEAAGFVEPVRLFFRDDTLRIVRSGLWSSDRDECERLLRNLPDPPDRLDLAFGTGLVADGEWVYAARGLALGVIPDTGLIVTVAAYRPCCVKTYRRCFHDGEPAREFPSSRRT